MIRRVPLDQLDHRGRETVRRRRWPTGANVEIPFVGTQLVDGAFVPTAREEAILKSVLDELGELAVLLRPAQNR